VLGLAAQLALGAWWIDPVTSLAIVLFLVKERARGLGHRGERLMTNSLGGIVTSYDLEVG